MPTLAVNNFNIVVSILGGWISLFGLVSYLCKESFYLSEACECSLYAAAFTETGADEDLLSLFSDIAPGWRSLFSSRGQLHQAA